MKKILVVRFSSIGDIVLTSPVIRCIKTQLPDAEVILLTKMQFIKVVEANPYIDRIITIQKDINEILPLLKAEKFSHIVDLHKSIRSVLLVSKLRVPSSSFPKLNIRKFIYCKLKIDLLPDVHIVDRYFKAVECLGVENDGLGLDYFIPSKDQIGKEQLPDTHKDGYISLVIGGKHATKQMPAEELIKLCRMIRKPLVIHGGPEDKAIAECIVENTSSQVYNACGKFNLNQSASLLSGADKVISHDTGLMHIAAALGKDILSIWGNTVPEFGMYPYFPKNFKGESRIVEVKNLHCRPCSKLGYPSCPKKHFHCMKKMDIQYIADWVNR